MNKSFAIACVLICVTLAGCNTVEGVGADISGAANAVRGWISR